MARLRQETIAIIGVGVALAMLGLSVAADLRDEIRAVRMEVEAVRVEAKADRDAIRAEARADREAIRAEARADREAFQKQMTEFQKQILRLTEGQGLLNGLIEGLLDERRTSGEAPAE